MHPDYYPYDHSKFLDPEERVNRVSTVMTVLEAPEAGGATAWPYLGVAVFPEKGSAAMWFNTRSDAQVCCRDRYFIFFYMFGKKET